MTNFIQSLSFKRIAALGCYVLISIGSSIPQRNIPSFFSFLPDKLLHTVEYFVFGFFLTIWVYGEWPDMKRKYLAIVLMGIVAAGLDEFHQKFTLGRTADIYDFFVDICAIVGSLICVCIYKAYQNDTVKKR